MRGPNQRLGTLRPGFLIVPSRINRDSLSRTGAALSEPSLQLIVIYLSYHALLDFDKPKNH